MISYDVAKTTSSKLTPPAPKKTTIVKSKKTVTPMKVSTKPVATKTTKRTYAADVSMPTKTKNRPTPTTVKTSISKTRKTWNPINPPPNAAMSKTKKKPILNVAKTTVIKEAKPLSMNSTKKTTMDKKNTQSHNKTKENGSNNPKIKNTKGIKNTSTQHRSNNNSDKKIVTLKTIKAKTKKRSSQQKHLQ